MAERRGPDPRAADIVKQMARKLVDDLARFKRLRDTRPPRTFPAFRDVRAMHIDLLGLLYSIEERVPECADQLPAGFAQWVVRQKLNEIAIFTDISHQFIGHPPIALTSSLGAFDVLQSEREASRKVLAEFDSMLMEAGIDDKTADELDATRSKIEETLAMIEELLRQSPKVLEEF